MPALPNKQAVAVELYYDSAWHDVAGTDDVYASTPIKIQRGQSEEGAAFKPSRINFTLANDDDKYRPSNPESALYGKVGRNTPARVKVGGAVRGYGEASFEPDQTDDFRISPPRGKAWVDVDAAGLLQRIGQWTEKLASPLTYYDTTEVQDVTGHWTMEDPAGTLVAYTPIPGAANTFLRGTNFGSQKRPPGGGSMADVELSDSSVFQFVTNDASSTVGWRWSAIVSMNSLNNTSFSVIQIALANDWDISLTLDDSTDTSTLTIFNAAGSSAGSQAASFAGFQWTGRVVMLNLDVSYSGGTTTVQVSYAGVDDSTWTSFSATYTGVPSQILSCNMNGLPEGSAFGHVIGTNSRVSDLRSSDRFAAMLGHAGETAAVRFGRLCDQKNVPYYVSAGFASSQAMGPQPVATFPELLKECVQTDDALLFDYRTGGRLLFLCRVDRYRQAALVLQADDLQHPPKEVLNDLDPHNVVTANQRDGGSYTVEDSTSSMGSQPPPSGVGEYRQTVDVNVADESTQLRDLAWWWLNKGTVALPRFPLVSIDLGAMPSLVSDVEALDVGDVIEIEGFREYPIRVFILGYVEVIDTHTRTITFTCAPDQQYNVGEWNASDSLWDMTRVELNGDHSSSTTSLSLKSYSDESWSTTDVPYDLMIAGERVTVGAMAARTGSGPWFQTATVTRHVNRVTKLLPGGSGVHVAEVGRWAL